MSVALRFLGHTWGSMLEMNALDARRNGGHTAVMAVVVPSIDIAEFQYRWKTWNGDQEKV